MKPNDLIDLLNITIEKTRKEMAKEILQEILKEVLDYLGVQTIEQANNLSLLDSTLTFDVVTDKIFELAQLIGVEVDER